MPYNGPVPTVINLNDTLPANPPGTVNVVFRGDGNNPRNVSGNFPNVGSVLPKSSSYTVEQKDRGKLLTFTGSGIGVMTLLKIVSLSQWLPLHKYFGGNKIYDSNSHVQQALVTGFTGPIEPIWNSSGGTTSDGDIIWQDLGLAVLGDFVMWFENLGTGILRITPTSPQLIDGFASLDIAQNQGVMVFADLPSQNYFTERGLGANDGGVNAQTGTSYTVVEDDRGKLITLSNASPVTVTLPNPTSLTLHFRVAFENLGAGLVTLTPSGATIDGLASLTIPKDQGVNVYSDGSNYFTERGLAPNDGGVNSQSGTSYTLVQSDRGKLVTLSNSSPVAVALPAASSLSFRFRVAFENLGAGLVTLTPSGSTIDGAVSLTIPKNQGVQVYSDGTNYFTERGLGPSDGGVDAQGGTSYTVVESDRGKLVTLNNAAPVAVALPAANTLSFRFRVAFENLGAGPVTLTPATSTIDGAASLIILKNQGVNVYSDGTNYFTERGLSANDGGVDAQSGTSYSVDESDRGKLVTLNNAAAVTVTLPDATTLSETFRVSFENLGAGLVTLIPATSTIDGVISLSLLQNQGVDVYSDGTNYFTERGIGLNDGGVDTQTGTSYTIVEDDRGKLVTFSNAVTVAVTLPDATTLSATFRVALENLGPGLVTIIPTTSTIDGLATLDLSKDQGIQVYSDGTNYFTERGLALNDGGVDAQTGTTYTIVESDRGKLVTFSNAAAVGVTLPDATTLTPTFRVALENLGPGMVTLIPTTSTIDGVASLDIGTNQGVNVYSDGTNYFTERGLGPTSTPYHLVHYLPGSPSASLIVLQWTCPDDLPNGVSFATDFGTNARGLVQANPTGTATYDFAKNGSSIGSLSISTSGVLTFTLTATHFAAGDTFTATFQGTVDATLAGVGFTLTGSR